MKRLEKCLLFVAIAAVAVVGFLPRAVHEASAPGEPTHYAVEELCHEPQYQWTQTVRVTDDEDWIVKVKGSDGMPARFYVPREAHERLHVGQELQSVPSTWGTTDPDSYALIECRDPRDDQIP